MNELHLIPTTKDLATHCHGGKLTNVERGTKSAHQSLDLSSWMDPPSLAYDLSLILI